MDQNINHLMTPLEAEEMLGKKYFYRQRIYRLAQNKEISSFQLKGQACFLGSHILKATLAGLNKKISAILPQVDLSTIRIFYDTAHGKRIVVDGLFGKGISVDTDNETEEDLLKKIETIADWIRTDTISSEITPEHIDSIMHEPETDESGLLTNVLPEEIAWMKVDTGIIEGVEIKSFILVSLPSVAQFIGIRTDKLVEWINGTSFRDLILSVHYRQVQGPRISVPWKRGVVSGLTPLIPFELLPELIVSFKQSGRSVQFPEKAQLLYEIAKNTLEAVGLAISGNRDRAAQELARVGKGLGLSVAEQIIGIFKQYETREFQVETTKKFHSKVKELNMDFAITAGSLIIGITDKTAGWWKALGASRRLPKKSLVSSREVMRALSPGDGVGMAFGEQHFIKEPNISEAVKTGRQGKDFYMRLKSVGLLDDDKH
jgi:hypothetical protein